MTLVELFIVLAMLGVLASSAMATYDSYVKRSKTSGAVRIVGELAKAEIIYYRKFESFIDAGPVNVPPSKLKVNVDFVSDSGFRALNFDLDAPTYFGVMASVTGGTSVDCEAYGDLDGDGTTSTFRRVVTLESDGSLKAGGIFYFDELE